ncbi:MAG: dockerin type I repeat-containing protein [Ruminococcus sp.]|nr:dockerin type I repeat-containing protein [Ruminococcus sp.]MDE7099248.1 dockerin type I repeat-containing protein [Ruminococcus sp.]
MKKLISTIMSLAVLCASLTAVNAGAIARPFDANSDEFAGYEELYHMDADYKKYAVDSFISAYYRGPHSVLVKKIVGDDGITHYDYINVNTFPASLSLKTCDEDKNSFDERIPEIFSLYGLECYIETAYSKDGIYEYEAIIPEDFSYAREMYSQIAEIVNVTGFDVYGGGRVMASGHGRITFESPTYYVYGISEKQIADLTEYIKEKNLDFTLERGKLVSEANGRYDDLYRCDLVPNYDIDFDEHLQVAADIANTLGIGIPFEFQASANTISDGSGNIDVLNSTDGDANEDGDMNIADATAIVQAIGNKDKYGLTAQGEFNADLDGNGLTAADAIAIQMKLAEMGMPE